MKKYLYKNELKTTAEISRDKDCKVNYKTLWFRLKENWPIEDATNIGPRETAIIEIGYYIYLITNLINNKKYIGRTTRKGFQKRWNEHLSTAKNHSRRRKMPLYHAINKYGKENFSFEIIDQAKNGEELALLETSYIMKYDTLSPKGYNLEIYQEYRRLSKKSKKNISKNQQGLKKQLNSTSKFKGVYKNKNSWKCEIAQNRIKYNKPFKTERLAAIAYDLMALYLYGKRAKINFINNKKRFLKANLNKFFQYFTYRKTKFEQGVWYDKSRKGWRSNYHLPNRKKHYNGQFRTKEEAILANKNYHDQIISQQN